MRLQSGFYYNKAVAKEFTSANYDVMMESQQTVCVKRLREKFPVEVVKAAVLFGVQALGYDEPTDEQMHILRAFLVGSDVFACLPTGSGKSLCYAALPSAFGYLHL